MFGSRQNNVKDDGGTQFFKMYEEQNKSNLIRELKSIYFGNVNDSVYENRVSILKLVIHKNDLTHNQSDPFKNGIIDEENIYNQVSISAVNCLGKNLRIVPG